MATTTLVTRNPIGCLRRLLLMKWIVLLTMTLVAIVKISIGAESPSVRQSATRRTATALLAWCLPTAQPLLDHLYVISRVAWAGMLSIPTLNVGFCQQCRCVAIHKSIESVFYNLVWNSQLESTHELWNKCWWICIPHQTILGQLHELVIVLSHSHISLGECLKLISNCPTVVGVKISLSK